MRIALLSLLVLLATSSTTAQAKWPKPDWEKVGGQWLSPCTDDGPQTQTYSLKNYQLRIDRVSESDVHDHLCRAYLTGENGFEKELLEDERISIHQGSGQDIFGSGNPTLVLEGYSGGAHCCYSYVIAELRATPVVLPEIENDSPFFFFKDDRSGQYRILTADGAFDYFDEMCHACSPFPHIVLEVSDGSVRDASSRYVAQYDTDISEARSKIRQDELGRFLTIAKLHDLDNQERFEELRQHVLEIVLSYLYSGREAQAWQTLDEMWPASDKFRIKRLILQTTRDGLLSKLNGSGPGPESERPQK